jgi:hypothetical protein
MVVIIDLSRFASETQPLRECDSSRFYAKKSKLGSSRGPIVAIRALEEDGLIADFEIARNTLGRNRALARRL